MKLFVYAASLTLILSSLVGCATLDTTGEPKLQPPDEFNAIFMKYKELPEEKVMVIAVDPSGRWAYGYGQSEATLEAAATNAVINCNEVRRDHNVSASAKIFAVNNDIIYYDDL